MAMRKVGNAYIADTARVLGNVTLGDDCNIWFGSVLRGDVAPITLGVGCNVQDNCVLHVDEGFPALLGRRVTVGHGAVVHGATIGDNCLVGIGARALNGSSMGEGAWLAAGSVLTEGRAIPAWTLALGTPAKPVRDLTDAEIAAQSEGVDHYLDLGAAYARLLG